MMKLSTKKSRTLLLDETYKVGSWTSIITLKEMYAHTCTIDTGILSTCNSGAMSAQKRAGRVLRPCPCTISVYTLMLCTSTLPGAYFQGM